MAEVTAAIISSCETVATGLTGVLTGILPIVIPVIGTVFVTKKGISIFKSIAGKA